MNKTTLTTPRIKKRMMNARNQGKKKKAGVKRTSSAVKYDQIMDDSVKRLV